MRYNRSASSKQESKVTTSSSRPGIHQPGGFDGGRRCQSAHARPSAQRSDHRIKQVRSHSQEPKPSSGVPIPQNGRVSDPSESHVERTDLTRMYDYATWNMYERIVNARRQRLSWLDAHQKTVGNSPIAADTSVETAPKATVDLHKVHSREDSSMTSSTVDDVESDKSSTTLSSASSSASSASGSNIKRSVFSLGASAIKAICQETQDKHLETENEEQDHFIFEMDL